MSALDEWSKIRQKEEAAAKVLRELEERGGIADEVRRAHEGFLFPTISVAPYGSDRQKREDENAKLAEREHINWKLRQAYFSVADIELRKQLIAKFREISELGRSRHRSEACDAQQKLGNARSTLKNDSWISASLAGAVLVALGSIGFGVPGAIGGALIALFYGRHLEQSDALARHQAIGSAERDVSEAEKYLAEALNEPEIFSANEERTGEADRSADTTAGP